ncbi:universal stress protein [Haloferax mediterranei ATCC 33500]|uniref:Universal stress protein n=1 Tax=Haloferax mediterranei (strain ATCC 33500 / DSM 1411 / JCM 8866 / NBRC 14739 / NCIMB 2177 / R-4) TaxID=523841 RepID=I3R749_HALMT|nr:universal stress protein [Haloferax mediterranei]AFK20059.1 universal stress protein UspA-like protein [Haloferax mediterranei ATCC 33500]AHZ23436.1 universal stress protein UspA [Haloferax mediterranei ATCC 33500]ELZ99607.1 universal stress protein UspA-like protein [Haloferax mediterranei ATCC 33500]MDX5987189.1 universal stress protein [Haloferax mediterranei ATCC 33500]QCQ76495.1 universal stress protein [Haloferax mediterranei ATCC 33500]
MAEHVLVPVDGSPQSVAALRFAASEWPDARITLLKVINPADADFRERALSGTEEWYQEEKRKANETFAEVKSEVDIERPVADITEVGSPEKAIVEVLEADGADFDHVVMGSHGRTGVSRILLGSVAEEVVRRSPVPVTIVR